MEILVAKVLPIIIYFSLGIIARKTAIATAEHGGFLIKLAMYYTLPALFLITFSKIHITAELLFLPLSGIFVSLAVGLFAYSISKYKHYDRKATGSLLVGSMAMNSAFAFPFALVLFGPEALTYALLYDLGNALMIFTVVYALAFYFGDNAMHGKKILQNIIRAPFLWTIFIALFMSFMEIHIPDILHEPFNALGSMTAPVLLMGMGISFAPARSHLAPAAEIIAIRMLGGLSAIMLIFFMVDIEDKQQIAMLMCAASPLGMTASAYSILAGLNTQTLISAASISILLGLAWLPFLSYFYM